MMHPLLTIKCKATPVDKEPWAKGLTILWIDAQNKQIRKVGFAFGFKYIMFTLLRMLLVHCWKRPWWPLISWQVIVMILYYMDWNETFPPLVVKHFQLSSSILKLYLNFLKLFYVTLTCICCEKRQYFKKIDKFNQTKMEKFNYFSCSS